MNPKTCEITLIVVASIFLPQVNYKVKKKVMR